MNDFTAPHLLRPHSQVGASAASDLLHVSGSDLFALGHYPGNPIYPGVLTAERLCELAAALASEHGGAPAHVAAIKRIQYLDAILPGDVVRLSASIKRIDEAGRIEVTAGAAVGDKAKTRATLICQPGPLPSCERAAPYAPPAVGPRRLEYSALSGLLPHRYPFLLVDRIEDYALGQWVRATRVVNRASPLFLEHTPASYPQGLAIESIGQAAIALFFLSGEAGRPVDVVLGSVAEASFERTIPFGSALALEARIERILPNGVMFSGSAHIGDQLVTRVGSMIAMVDPR